MKSKTTDEKLLDLFSDLDKQHDFPVRELQKKVAIISTPRCGSSMFCDILRKTGVIGTPLEWVNMRYLGAYSKYFELNNIDMSQYLDFIYRKTTSPNGIFAINFHIEQYVEMLKHKFNIFDLNFDKSYYLFRKEKINQAYSLAKASITDQWSFDTKSTNELKSKIGREKILQALIQISRSEDYYYDKNMKSFIDKEYFYEDFSSLDTTSTFSEILCELEIPPSKTHWTTSMKKQSKEEDWSELNTLKEYLSPSAIWEV